MLSLGAPACARGRSRRPPTYAQGRGVCAWLDGRGLVPRRTCGRGVIRFILGVTRSAWDPKAPRRWRGARGPGFRFRSAHTDLSVGLSVCLSVRPSVFLSVYLPTYLPTYLRIYLFICLPTCLPTHRSVCLSVCRSIDPTCQTINLSIYQSIYLSVYLTTYLPTYLSLSLAK